MATLIAITVLSIGLFMVAFWLLRIVSVAKDAIATVKGALATMRAPDLDDDAREAAVQKAAVRLITISASLVGRCAFALAAAFVPIYLAHAAGVARMEDSLAFMERWDVILIASLLILAGYLTGKRLWRR